MREIEQRLEHKCPFCRHPAPELQDEVEKNLMKRVELNDPFAMCHLGKIRVDEGDYNCAFEYWTKAANLGDAAAHYIYQLCITRGKVLGRTRKRSCTIWKRLPLVGIPVLDVISGATRGTMVGAREQRTFYHRRKAWR